MIRRQHWRKQPCNDGKVRVLVPRAWLEAGQTRDSVPPPANPTDEPPPSPPNPTDAVVDPADKTREFHALADAVAVLREQLTQERQRANKAELRVETLTLQLEATRSALDSADASARQAEIRAIVVEQAAQQVQDDAEAAEAARKAGVADPAQGGVAGGIGGCSGRAT